MPMYCFLYAEVLNEWKQGPTDEAYKAINMVRRRGFGLPVETDNSASDLSGMSYTEFQQAVRNERAFTNWHLKDIADKIWYAGESIMKVSEKHLKI